MAQVHYIFLLISSCIYIISAEPGIGNLSTSQLAAFKAFKSFALKLENPEYLKTDLYLLRWLKAYKFDVKKTQKQFSLSRKWRVDNNADNLLAEEFPAFIPMEFPFIMDSLDKLGRPVAFSQTGRYDFRKMALKGQADTMNRFGYLTHELMEAYSYALQCSGNWTDGVVPQYTLIVDMAGGSAWTQSCFNCIKKVPEYVRAYDLIYPELIVRAVMFNIPRLMVVVLNSLINFMSPATQAAIKVYGFDKEEWLEALLETISSDQIPIHYGGTKNVTPVTGHKDGTWNWHNPVIDNILKEARETGTFQIDGCFSKPDPIPSVEDKNEEFISEPNNFIPVEAEVEVPTVHRHRHGHGLVHHHKELEQNASKPVSDSEIFNTTTSHVNKPVFIVEELETETNIISTKHLDEGLFDYPDKHEEGVTVMPRTKHKNTKIAKIDVRVRSSIPKNSNNDFVFENRVSKAENESIREHSSSSCLPNLSFYFVLSLLVLRSGLFQNIALGSVESFALI